LRLVPSANRIAANIGLVRSGRAYLSDLHGEWQWLSVLPPKSAEMAFPLRLDSTIRLESVGFTYPESDRPSLRDIEMTIRRGEAIGIVGPIGAGKSTLIKLLLGLLRPSHGRLLVDGIDLQSRLASWQHAVGYVPQKPFLIADTIRRNIALGQPDVTIDEGAVRWALRTAGLDPVIERLREGIDTVLGESGAGLSGGEQQLLVIARALYRRPSVLLLDEPAASLDPVAQAEIGVVLAALKGGVTIVAVGHRPEELAWCERILEMRGGQFIASE
jgi:ATP-binding cassette subfamily C protein